MSRSPASDPPDVVDGSVGGAVRLDRPEPVSERPRMEWGSDAMAATLEALDLPYLSFNPGASYRGLHDSLVNFLGDSGPGMIQCLHEEHAVAIAHGFAKVTGTPMAVALHSNVGLMHASMALFNAYCDRVPMVVLGATGPLDARKRRPWIEWIHTSADQAALIRHYCKWDDQPGSIGAAVDALVRADTITRSLPSAPTYVVLDAGLQEAPLPEDLELPDVSRAGVPRTAVPADADVRMVAELLEAAQRPALLVGRVGRTAAAWDERVALAERYGAVVLTDIKTAAVFPTRHSLHPTGAGSRPGVLAQQLLRQADAIVSLDWIDLGGTLATADVTEATVVSCSLDSVLHNGWNKEHFQPATVDIALQASPDALVSTLLQLETPGPREHQDWPPPAEVVATPSGGRTDGARMSELAGALKRALRGHAVSWTSLPLGWIPGDADFDGPLDYLGRDGGAGIGSGPGLSVGAALALAGTGRIPVAVLGDGDTLMGASALWTAAHHRLPLLVVVANNRSFYNDEVHQERVARQRSRPPGNRWVGQHIRNPDPDLPGLARSLGFIGYGPVSADDELNKVLGAAVADVAAGGCALVDVQVTSHDYQAATG